MMCRFTIEEGRTLGRRGRIWLRQVHLRADSVGAAGADREDRSSSAEKDYHRERQTAQASFEKEMQIIFQDPYSSLNPRYCVFELVADPIKTYHLYKTKEELKERVFELMDVVGLAQRYAYAYPHELDGGRRQRVGIARALSLDPSVHRL